MMSPFDSEQEANVKTQAYLEYLEIKINTIQNSIAGLFREANIPKHRLPESGDKTSNMIKMLRDHYGAEQ